MKKLTILIIRLATTMVAACPPVGGLTIEAGEPIRPHETLWKAICTVESQNNPMAYNKKEGAVGIAQIRQIWLDDYEQRTGIHYELTEMYDTTKAKSVFMWHCSQYHHTEIERIVRTYNGGPSGMKKQTTIKYYRKVLRQNH